jgi:hypothetical protein
MKSLTYEAINAQILKTLEPPSQKYWIVVGLLFIGVLIGAGCWAYQIAYGILLVPYSCRYVAGALCDHHQLIEQGLHSLCLGFLLPFSDRNRHHVQHVLLFFAAVYTFCPLHSTRFHKRAQRARAAAYEGEVSWLMDAEYWGSFNMWTN